MEKTTSWKELINNIISQYPPQEKLHLVFGGCRVLVCSTSKPLIEKLTHYFNGFLTAPSVADLTIMALDGHPPDFGLDFKIRQPDLHKTKIKEAYVDFMEGRIVRKLLTGMILAFDGELNLAIGPCLLNSNQVINFINNRYIEWKLNQGCLLMHASAVQINGQGLVIGGFSGKGKSTLALQLMNEGATFVSNDRVMLAKTSAGPFIFGVAKLPRVNPGTILNNPRLSKIFSEEKHREMSLMTKEALWEVEEKYDIPVVDIFGHNRITLEAPLRAVVILNWDKNNSSVVFQKINLKRRPDLLLSIQKDPGLFFKPTYTNYFSEFTLPESYFEHLKECDIYEVTGGADFEQAAKTCLELLRK